MYRYPATLAKDEGTILVKFRDVPEAITYGAMREEALRHAQEALETALMFYIDGGKPLPKPSTARRGEGEVDVTARAAMKLALYEAYRTAGVTKSELARRMSIPKTNVDRLFSLTHASRVDHIEAAAAALGKRLVISMRNVAAMIAIFFLCTLQLRGQVQENFAVSCNEAWRAGVESYRESGLIARQLDRDGGTALLRPVGGAIEGLSRSKEYSRKFTTQTAWLTDQLFVEVTVTFSPRQEGKVCRVWVGADFVASGQGVRTPMRSNGKLETEILAGIRRALE